MVLYFYNGLYFSHKNSFPDINGQLLYMSQEGSRAPSAPRAAKGSAPPNPCGDGAPGVGVAGEYCELRWVFNPFFH